MSNQAVTKTPAGILDLLSTDRFKDSIRTVLSRDLTPDRFVGFALNYVRNVPALMRCDQASFFAAIKRVAELGLEPNGRDCYLIPYGNACTLIVSVHGLKKLVMRSGNVARIHSDVVRENDEFDYNCGVVNRHSYKLGQPRGKIIGAYCVIEFKDGNQSAEVMDLEQVEAIRSRSKAKDSGPWRTDYEMMVRKTVTRRTCNQAQWGISIPEAIDDDDVIDVPSRGPSIGGRAITSANDIPGEFEIPATTDAIPDTGKKSEPKTAPTVPTDAQNRAAILARLSAEKIDPKSFFDGFMSKPLAEWDAESVAKLAADLDKQIAEFRNPDN